MSTVVEWLSDAGFERYADAFAEQDITLDVLPELNDADLKELGVATLGDRKRLLKALAALAAPPAAAGTATASTGLTPPAAVASFVAEAAHGHEAERRPLTVVSRGRAGPPQWSGRLDPEDLQNVVRSFHAPIAGAVGAYDGLVAQ